MHNLRVSLGYALNIPLTVDSIHSAISAVAAASITSKLLDHIRDWLQTLVARFITFDESFTD